MLLSRGGGVIVVGWYAKKAWEDGTNDSWSSEFKDRGNCAHPLSEILAVTKARAAAQHNTS
ncbi:hypothetical protein ACIP4Q_28350 [Streptomyces massasporeus]